MLRDYMQYLKNKYADKISIKIGDEELKTSYDKLHDAMIETMTYNISRRNYKANYNNLRDLDRR